MTDVAIAHEESHIGATCFLDSRSGIERSFRKFLGHPLGCTFVMTVFVGVRIMLHLYGFFFGGGSVAGAVPLEHAFMQKLLRSYHARLPPAGVRRILLIYIYIYIDVRSTAADIVPKQISHR